jgi:uncharacterized protein YkwD
MPRPIALAALLALASCAAAPPAAYDAAGRPLPQVYRIEPGSSDIVQLRFLDGMNAVRQAAGAAPVALNSELTAAAATHSRDMSVQNRPWHFGSDGSSPLERADRVGYPGRLLGENISETYETELETLAAWMEAPETRDVVTDPEARDLGFSWFQESNGKIWWTMVTGTRQSEAIAQTAGILVAPPLER